MTKEEISQSLKEISKEQFKLESKRRKLNSILNNIESDEKMSKAKEFEGKYFIEKEDRHFSQYVRCLFIYAIDPNLYSQIALKITYSSNPDDGHYSIEDYRHFDPKDTSWEETDKETFEFHYNNVKQIMDNLIGQK
jgi:hypothetical protein